MKKYLVLFLLLVAATSSTTFAARNDEPMPPEFPSAGDEQLPEDGPEIDYAGEETYETGPEEGDGGMIGEILRTQKNGAIETTVQKEDRGDVFVYTMTTQQPRGLELCVTTTITVVHKTTEKILSSNTDTACYNYNY